jgi:2-desacetyl-2-hydroxyethyl bacteriochlorophyllide A dehydrogenase
MLAGQITEPGRAAVITAPEPAVGPDDVLIAVHAAGICGTDLHIFKGEYEARYPLIPGHEFSGIVAAVGSNVTRFRVGDRVTADPNIPCNRCPACQRNMPNQCEHLAAIGVTRAGAFAQYVTAPEGNVFPIGSMSFAAAALVEPLACVVWGLKRVQVQPGDSALVFGAGPMGCLVAQALRHAGAAQVVIADPVQYRLGIAQQIGIPNTVLVDGTETVSLRAVAPSGFDIVTDATGLPAVVEQAFRFVRPRGKLWIFGVVPPGQRASFIPYDVFRHDLTIIGSFAVNRTFYESIALIQSGAVQVEPLISHRLPLGEFLRGFELAEHDPQRMKIQFSLEN